MENNELFNGKVVLSIVNHKGVSSTTGKEYNFNTYHVTIGNTTIKFEPSKEDRNLLDYLIAQGLK